MQGKKSAIALVSVLFVFMFVVTDLYTIQIYSDMYGTDQKYANVLKNFVGADIGPARSAFSRADLVTELMAVTTDTTDSDFDNIVDSIEAIIGTDPANNDTDFDKVRDDFEVWNGTDPLEPDSNFDGLPDYFELQASNPDVDGDGIDNAWDFDNDNDGVNDDADLSPFCYSDVQDRFHMEIITGGNPTYVTLQFRPRDPAHLKFFYQFWDWPYDTEGLMRDTDYSEEDVRAIPQLNVTTDILPSQSDVSDYGMLVTETGYHVPVNPVWDKGDLVAFECKIFLPQSAQTSTVIDTELFWRIMGNTDISASAMLASNGMYVTLGNDNTVVAAGDYFTGGLQWINLGDGNVSLKFFNGRYMSLTDGDTIGTSSILDDNAKFAFTKDEDAVTLRAINGMNITLDSSGILVAQSAEAAIFQLLDMGVQSEWTTLATYTEPIMVTGLTVEENFESHLGLFYSSIKDPVFAANLLMSYAFMRNSTNILYDQPSILANNNIDVDDLLRSFAHRDVAFTNMSNELLPGVLNSLPDNEILPIIIANEDHSRILEMSEIVSGVKTYADSFLLNVTKFKITEVRTLKMNFYNTTDNRALALDTTLQEVVSWNLSEIATFNVLTMVMKWFTGEQLVASIDASPVSFVKVPNDASSLPQTIILSGLEGLAAISELMWIFTAFKDMKALQKGGFAFNSAVRSITLESKSIIGAWAKTSRSLEKLNKGFTKGFKSFQSLLAVAGAIIDVGIAVYSAIMLANSIGGKVGDEVGAVYGVTASLVAISGAAILLAIGAIPYVGWIIALALVIADLIGNYSDKLIAWLSGAIFGDQEDVSRVVPNIEILGTPSPSIIDPDGNGLDIGDTIEILVRFCGTVTEELDHAIPTTSYMRPYIEIFVPQGEISASGYPSVDNMDVDYASYWKTEIYDTYAWAEPSVPMVNYPVWVFLKYDYHLRYEWKHLVMGMVYCHHTEWNDGSNSTSLTKYHFDVMPASIDEFARWGAISLLDSDGDELKNSEETTTDAWKYDSDGDSLRDKYEIDYGLDPNNYDGDGDGLSDKWELYYGTDATKSDSDEDGLPDSVEVKGWNIEFNYTQTEGSVIIPFTTHVFSDPRNNDSDGDSIEDFLEYQSSLNPQSRDTNGDSIPDQPAPETETVIEEVWQKSIGTSSGFAIDSANDIHVALTSPSYSISKFNPNGDHLLNYGSGELTFPMSIATDELDSVFINDWRMPTFDPQVWVPAYTNSHYPTIAMSRDGNTLAVGEPYCQKVWIYTRESLGWILQQIIPTPFSSDHFGFSLSFTGDGNTLAIGAPGANAAQIRNSGSVHIWRRSGTVWTWTDYLPAPADYVHYFGGDVSFTSNGQWLVISEGYDNNFFIYGLVGDNYQYVQAYTLPNSEHLIVRSVDVNDVGNRIVVGAVDSYGGTGDAKAFVYEYWDGIWYPFELIAPERIPGDEFGEAISINDAGTTVIVGAPHLSDVSRGPGAAYVFQKDDVGIFWSTSQIELSKLSDPSGGTNYCFGESIQLTHTGDRALIGSPGRGRGGMFVFDNIGSIWTPLSWVEQPTETAHTRFGHAVAMDASGSRLMGVGIQNDNLQPMPVFEFSTAPDRIVRFDSDGALNDVFIPQLAWGFSNELRAIWGMTTDSENNLYVSYRDAAIAGIRKYSPSGEMIGYIGGEWLFQPFGVSVDTDGNIYVADRGNNDVLKFSATGELLPAPWSGFLEPRAVAVDSDGNVYIADTGHNRVHIFDENGINVTSFSFNEPTAIQLDEYDNLYVANPYKLVKYRVSEIYVEIEPPSDVADWDADGLTNEEETTGWDIVFVASDGTWSIHVDSDPSKIDSDLDGLTDFQERELGTNPQSIDTDRDALDDFFEWSNDYNPSNFDTDGELLDDSTELTFGSHPRIVDTDHDGTNDYIEFLHGTNPRSADTDNDGATDTEELDAGTDPLSPDSDGDFVFDGSELDQGTDPNEGDSDHDFIDDGLEGIIGTNPLSNDSDGDSITDFVEISLNLNPLSNDSDGDSIPDNIELFQGTDPRNNDTDGDGVPDNLDPDSSTEESGDIIIVCDNLDNPAFAAFANNLVNYHNAIIIGLEDFLANYTNSPWVILLGQLSVNPDTVGNLIYTHLEDAPDVLQSMLEPGGDHIAVRYGVWNETQTVVMLSECTLKDIYPVLLVLKEKNVTMEDNALIVEFPLLTDTQHIVNIVLSLDDIDVVKTTDSEVMVSLSEPAQPILMIGLYNESTTPFQLTDETGLDVYAESMGKYLEIDLSVVGSEDSPVETAMIRMYYKESELDRTGDGLVLDIDDLNETTLVLYYYDEVEGVWIKNHDGLDWVIATGVNTTDVYLFGEVYAGYVWAYVTHLSLYSIAGMTHNRPPDVSGAVPSIEFLWPPNGKFVEVTIEGIFDPDGDAVTITILNITSDEFVGCSPDAYGVGTDTAWLRAERDGCGNGRVYEITFLASDGQGGETIGSVFVYVPHDKKKCVFIVPINDGQIYDATKSWRPMRWRHWFGLWHHHRNHKCR